MSSPHMSEEVALSMMEAMSSGLPLISSNAKETPVLVENERISWWKTESRETAMKKHDRSQFFRKFMSTVQEVLDANS
jgi:glycosyltransferase involved in cell wall biosynthesis